LALPLLNRGRAIKEELSVGNGSEREVPSPTSYYLEKEEEKLSNARNLLGNKTNEERRENPPPFGSSWEGFISRK